MEPVHPLRAWRKLHDVTQTDFAERIGLTPGHISLLETGKRGVSLVKALRIERETSGKVPVAALVQGSAE